MANTPFKRLIKGAKKAARADAPKPWEEASSPHCAACSDASSAETTESHGVQRGRFASTDTNTTTEASDALSPKDTKTGSRLPADGSSRTGIPLKVYTDESVCRALGIRRRIVAAAKTEESRGRDWDAINEECGVTHEWVCAYALANGIVPKFGLLEECSGKFVSVRLVGTTTNRSMCLAETLADGKREFARIRDIFAHPIHYKEAFDCLRVGGRLEWSGCQNGVKY